VKECTETPSADLIDATDLTTARYDRRGERAKQ
jgi:hypothetical protein